MAEVGEEVLEVVLVLLEAVRRVLRILDVVALVEVRIRDVVALVEVLGVLEVELRILVVVALVEVRGALEVERWSCWARRRQRRASGRTASTASQRGETLVWAEDRRLRTLVCWGEESVEIWVEPGSKRERGRVESA